MRQPVISRQSSEPRLLLLDAPPGSSGNRFDRGIKTSNRLRDTCHSLVMAGLGAMAVFGSAGCSEVSTEPCPSTTTGVTTGTGGINTTSGTDVGGSSSTSTNTDGMECPVDAPLLPQDEFCDSYTGPTGPRFCTTSADCQAPFTNCVNTVSVVYQQGICSFDPQLCSTGGGINAGDQCYINDKGETLSISAAFSKQHCGGPCNPVPEGWSCAYGLPTQCTDKLMQDCLVQFPPLNTLPHCTLVSVDGQPSKGSFEICFDGLNDNTNCGSYGKFCKEGEECKFGQCQ